MTSLDWDDLRYVFAVHANGSVAGAARALRVNHTTVLRRIGAFEARLGITLFDRLPSGYVLTAGGEELVETAGRINDSRHGPGAPALPAGTQGSRARCAWPRPTR